MKDLQNVNLTHEEYMRYSRHLIMPEVGMQGQKRLKAASILFILYEARSCTPPECNPPLLGFRH